MNRYRSERTIDAGYRGEDAVAEILRRRGYSVELNLTADTDILVDGVLTVEVKTAHLSAAAGNRSRRWQFCLLPHPERQKPLDKDVLILRCECDPAVHFVVPGMVVPFALSKIDITAENPRRYQGRWAEFYEDWNVIDQLLSYIHRRRSLG